MEARTWWWIGGGAVVLAVVLFFVLSDDSTTTTTTIAEAVETTTTVPEETTTTPEETTTTAGEETTTTEGVVFTAKKTCFVTDDAGVDDLSFNFSGWEGVKAAVASGAAVDDGTFPILLESVSEADYQPHIETCLAAGSEHIVTTGFKLGPTVEVFAPQNPDVQWTLIDAGSNAANVAGSEFQTDEAAFAAGYLAAGVTQTGIVATYGGANIPTVAIFLDGYARGVAHYNDVKGTSVQVLGWDVAAQDGNFTGTFDEADPLVRATCESQLDEGADIILPVGGAINLPCGTAIQDRGIDAGLIGVDADAYEAMGEQYQDVWLVTVLKGLKEAVTGSIEADASGSPLGGNSFVGNLANGAVGLSGFHSWSDRVSDELAAEVAQILVDVESGAITWDKFPVGG